MLVEIELDEFTWKAFEETCELEGHDPAASLAWHVRHSIDTFLVNVERDADPAEAAHHLHLKTVMAAFVRECGPKRDHWPWTDDGKPETFEAAIHEAEERGRRICAE